MSYSKEFHLLEELMAVLESRTRIYRAETTETLSTQQTRIGFP